MNKYLKLFLILFALGIIAFALVFMFVYNKPHKNFEKAKPEYVLDAKTLFDEFKAQKEASSEKYNGKVLKISGEIKAVEVSDTSAIIVFAFAEGMFGDEGVRCSMLPKFIMQAKSLEAGTKVTLKGFCSGYNDTDVIMESCSFTKKQD